MLLFTSSFVGKLPRKFSSLKNDSEESGILVNMLIELVIMVSVREWPV